MLEVLVDGVHWSPDPRDPTGFEAAANKIHVADYLGPGATGDEVLVQGMKYAEALAARLEQSGHPSRVVLSRDPESDEVTVRFFGRRAGPGWSSDDPDRYELEEVAHWDV